METTHPRLERGQGQERGMRTRCRLRNAGASNRDGRISVLSAKGQVIYVHRRQSCQPPLLKQQLLWANSQQPLARQSTGNPQQLGSVRPHGGVDWEPV